MSVSYGDGSGDGSPPSRGAWIEIAFYIGEAPDVSVAPLAGGVD